MMNAVLDALTVYLNVAVFTTTVYLGLRILEQQYDAMDR